MNVVKVNAMFPRVLCNWGKLHCQFNAYKHAQHAVHECRECHVQRFAGYLSMPANIVCLVTTCGDHNCLYKYNHSIHEYAQVGATVQNLNQCAVQ